jgi:hypothetical protein
MTWQGERTIYGVNCEGGAWSGLRCSGRLVEGDRFRFRASQARSEVLYWVAGSKARSGKLSDCQVKDRDNWACNAEVGQPPVIALEFSNGRPVPQANGLVLPFHAVRKWKWLALHAGVSWLAYADFSSDLPYSRKGSR